MSGNGGATSHRSAPLLDIRSVGKTFGTKVVALEGISFEIRDNELFTLLGPSGCGKTTLLRMLAGFEQPTTGQILLENRDIAGDPPFRRPVNTMFQSYALFPHLNVRQNVAYGLEMLKWSRPAITARVDEVLALVHMGDFADRRANQLSGGQQQRIALARALAPKPKLLLLDEPLSALDLKLRKAMQIELKRLQRETSLTFVMVTHDQEEALALSDRIAVMSRGRVQQVGTPEDIYAHPANRFVADFIGEANLVPAAAVGGPAGSTVVVRPEQIEIGNGRPGYRTVGATVGSLTFLGADTLVEAHIPGGSVFRVRQRGAIHGLSPGDRVDMSWSPTHEWVVTE